MIVMDRLLAGHSSYIVTDISPYLPTKYVPNYIEVANECYFFSIIHVYPKTALNKACCKWCMFIREFCRQLDRVQYLQHTPPAFQSRSYCLLFHDLNIILYTYTCVNSSDSCGWLIIFYYMYIISKQDSKSDLVIKSYHKSIIFGN